MNNENMKYVTTFHPESACPGCGYRLDASSSFRGYRPKKDDISVCLKCGMPLVYGDEELHLRKMTPEEMEELSPEEQAELISYIAAQQHMNGGRA